ncbi:uncharacterized protein LOC118450738 [Vespa mandarinia]|uniref:uncharacterized protein LOC118450738 n=1 Tax=Vespa mandarinia TaxID=7446 RepID=UPI001610851F|nr:uncharacterized protein LOC118450738 [Vespa mandarinia]
MLYGAVVWAEAQRHHKYLKRIAAILRRCTLRIACSYRTISEPAVHVITDVIPIDLLTQESQSVHHQRPVLGKEEASRLARSTSIETWQSRWEQVLCGIWTAQLISRPDSWLNREASEVDFYLTQFLIGHGLFCSFLAKMRKVA